MNIHMVRQGACLIAAPHALTDSELMRLRDTLVARVDRQRLCGVILDLTAFDVVTSRAFASLTDFVALTRQHLAPAGVWLAMKGKDPVDERAALPVDIDVFHVEQLTVPGLDAERCLVWMRPKPSL